MKKIIIILTVLVSSLNTHCLKGQQSEYRIANEEVREKVELITDRNIYLSGENIWFSAVITINIPDSVRQLSNVLYVEVYRNDQAVIQRKFRIKNWTVQGMITIPEELPSANYYLRAYTRYQRNFLPDSYFTTFLTIVNPENPILKTNEETGKLLDIMPVCGKMINGLQTKLAVKIHPGIVKEIKSSFIQDQNHNIVDSVNFFNNGIALVEFIPFDSLNYSLSVLLSSGDTLNDPLPPVSQKGIIIIADPYSRTIDLYASRTFFDKNSSHYNLLILTDDQIRHQIPVVITNAHQRIPIDLSVENDGIYFIGVQNKKGDILAYTSYYLPPEIVQVDPKIRKDKFGPREAVQMELPMDDQFRKELKFLTISVIKKGAERVSGQSLPESIVDNPKLLPAFSYILDMNDESIMKQLEAVLILHRNALNYGLSQNLQMNKWLAETRDVSISGIVRNAKNNKPLQDKWIYASVLGKNPQFHAYRSREDGFFVFSLNHLRNDREVSITTDSVPDVDVEFLIYNDFSDKWPAAQDLPLYIDSNQRELLKEMWINYQVEKQFLPKSKISESGIDSIPFPFSDVTESIKLDNYIAIPTMTEVLNELVPFVNVRKRKGEDQINIVEETKQNIYEHPLILVDYLPVFDVAKILSINPAKVERIDMIDKPFSFGDLLIEGVLIIHTNTKDFAGIHLPPSSVFVEYRTVTPSAEITFPSYNHNKDEQRHNPDFRNLLYWNPYLKAIDNTTITFYTADELTDYEIILKGQMKDGRTVFGKQKISVSDH